MRRQRGADTHRCLAQPSGAAIFFSARSAAMVSSRKMRGRRAHLRFGAD
jgi:hypothetical protein